MLRIFRNGTSKGPLLYEHSEYDSQEGQSCIVELSQTSQSSYSTVLPRQCRPSAQLPQGLVSKWVELEAQWRQANEVGSQVAEKAYVQAYENLVISEEETVAGSSETAHQNLTQAAQAQTRNNEKTQTKENHN
eukprot:TRINITY_DN8671_c0_g1_i2.p2 TRINITY_DN8671_c0_g1~~TRINITY_DN8671_c0_g1_i2.p2  ORF type:complete len:153 (+),score=5.59 TRINITY_DN8671_c0_g1_i2:61-459(+)